jgi:hypothetical protein
MSAESLGEEILQKMKEAGQLYHRLTLVVGPPGSGKTRGLHHVKDITGAPLINVNMELSKRMLDLTERQRCLQIARLLDEIVKEAASEVVLLDNLEILFNVDLQQDPLRLLQGMSRNRTVVATWNGSIENNRLIYAAPEHPEYRKYPVTDLLTVIVKKVE